VKTSHQTFPSAYSSEPPEEPSAEVLELQETLKKIGLARFIGRINSGVIPDHAGYEAVQNFVSDEQSRPLLSLFTQALLGRTDSYTRR
jgi:hypothetical protein